MGAGIPVGAGDLIDLVGCVGERGEQVARRTRTFSPRASRDKRCHGSGESERRDRPTIVKRHNACETEPVKGHFEEPAIAFQAVIETIGTPLAADHRGSKVLAATALGLGSPPRADCDLRSWRLVIEPDAIDIMQAWDSCHLAVLDRAACLALLAVPRVGALAVTEHALPVVLPVAYALDGDELVMRVARASLVARAAPGHVVAFCAHSGHLHVGGWRVAVTGVAGRVPSPDEATRHPPGPVGGWSGGSDEIWLRLPTEVMTGRRLEPTGTLGQGNGTRHVTTVPPVGPATTVASPP